MIYSKYNEAYFKTLSIGFENMKEFYSIHGVISEDAMELLQRRVTLGEMLENLCEYQYLVDCGYARENIDDFEASFIDFISKNPKLQEDSLWNKHMPPLSEATKAAIYNHKKEVSLKEALADPFNNNMGTNNLRIKYLEEWSIDMEEYGTPFLESYDSDTAKFNESKMHYIFKRRLLQIKIQGLATNQKERIHLADLSHITKH